jgi:hypothetical protein
MLIAANYSLKQRYGKSIEDFAEGRFTKHFDDQAGVEPEQYWKERYTEMKDQLDVFNTLKNKESTNSDIAGLKVGKEEQLRNFAEREKAEKKALEEYAEKARNEIIEEVYPNPSDELKSREQQVKERYWKQDLNKTELPDPNISETKQDESKKKD